MTGSDKLASFLRTHGPTVVRVVLHHTASGGKVTTRIELSDAERAVVERADVALPTHRAETILREHFTYVAREDLGDNVRYATFAVSGFHATPVAS